MLAGQPVGLLVYVFVWLLVSMVACLYVELVDCWCVYLFVCCLPACVFVCESVGVFALCLLAEQSLCYEVFSYLVMCVCLSDRLFVCVFD